MKKIGFERRYVSCQFNNLKACCLPLECPDLTSPVPTRVPSRGSSQSNNWTKNLVLKKEWKWIWEKLVISRNFPSFKYFEFHKCKWQMWKQLHALNCSNGKLADSSFHAFYEVIARIFVLGIRSNMYLNGQTIFRIQISST